MVLGENCFRNSYFLGYANYPAMGNYRKWNEVGIGFIPGYETQW